MFDAKSDRFGVNLDLRLVVGRTKWSLEPLLVGSRFGQEFLLVSRGQMHVRTRPLGRADFFLELLIIMNSAAMVNSYIVIDPSLIHVRTDCAYRPEGWGSFRTNMPKS